MVIPRQNIVPMHDIPKWAHSSNGTFDSKSTYKLASVDQEVTDPQNLGGFLSIKWIWSLNASSTVTFLERLPTKSVLFGRKVSHDFSCQICSHVLEDVKHVLEATILFKIC